MMKISEEYQITLHDDLAGYMDDFDSLAFEASKHGIVRINISNNGRVITVEAGEECSGIRDVIGWLAESIPDVTLIGQIIQKDTYEPMWDDVEENNVYHIEFDN